MEESKKEVEKETSINKETPENFEKMIEELKKERDELMRYSRELKAMYENYKQDSIKQRERLLKNANEYLISKLIPVLDDMERAFNHVEETHSYKHFYKGMKMIYSSLWKVLNDEGLVRIDVGKTFDPFEHEAVEKVESSEHEEYSVIDIVEHGYKYHNKVIKPAKVKVAIKPRGEGRAKTE